MPREWSCDPLRRPTHPQSNTELQDRLSQQQEAAHKGEGPSAIEAVAFRWHGHFEGDPQAYRDKKTIAELRVSADPLTIFRSRVMAEEMLQASQVDEIDAEVVEEVAQAVDYALAAPQPNPSELLTDVYVSY